MPNNYYYAINRSETVLTSTIDDLAALNAISVEYFQAEEES